jgi:hypothetical protein
MIPATQPTGHARATPAGGSRTRIAVGAGLAAALIGGIVVVAVAAGDDDDEAAATPPVAASTVAAVEPAVQPPSAVTGLGIVATVEACAAMPAEVKKSIRESADDMIRQLDRPLTGDYAEYVRPKCALTGEHLSDSLQEYGCAPRRRATGKGFSVPIPIGWEVLRAEGQLENEIILEERLPEIGRSLRTGMYLELVPYAPTRDSTLAEADCQALGRRVAGNQTATLDSVGIIATAIGPACRSMVHDQEERRLGLSVAVARTHILGATCTYDPARRTPPAACTEIVDGFKAE